jgi:hypothetical protein
MHCHDAYLAPKLPEATSQVGCCRGRRSDDPLVLHLRESCRDSARHQLLVTVRQLGRNGRRLLPSMLVSSNLLAS